MENRYIYLLINSIGIRQRDCFISSLLTYPTISNKLNNPIMTKQKWQIKKHIRNKWIYSKETSPQGITKYYKRYQNTDINYEIDLSEYLLSFN